MGCTPSSPSADKDLTENVEYMDCGYPISFKNIQDGIKRLKNKDDKRCVRYCYKLLSSDTQEYKSITVYCDEKTLVFKRTRHIRVEKDKKGRIQHKRSEDGPPIWSEGNIKYDLVDCGDTIHLDKLKEKLEQTDDRYVKYCKDNLPSIDIFGKTSFQYKSITVYRDCGKRPVVFQVSTQKSQHIQVKRVDKDAIFHYESEDGLTKKSNVHDRDCGDTLSLEKVKNVMNGDTDEEVKNLVKYVLECAEKLPWNNTDYKSISVHCNKEVVLFRTSEVSTKVCSHIRVEKDENGEPRLYENEDCPPENSKSTVHVHCEPSISSENIEEGFKMFEKKEDIWMVKYCFNLLPSDIDNSQIPQYKSITIYGNEKILVFMASKVSTRACKHIRVEKDYKGDLYHYESKDGPPEESKDTIYVICDSSITSERTRDKGVREK